MVHLNSRTQTVLVFVTVPGISFITRSERPSTETNQFDRSTQSNGTSKISRARLSSILTTISVAENLHNGAGVVDFHYYF